VVDGITGPLVGKGLKLFVQKSHHLVKRQRLLVLRVILWHSPSLQHFSGFVLRTAGVNTIEALNLLEEADLKRHGHYTVSPESLYDFIQICQVGHFLPYWTPELVKMYLPGIDPAPEARVKKENARLLWQKMNEPVWRQIFSAMKPKSAGANHSAGV